MAMTKDQLVATIKDICGPLVADAVTASMDARGNAGGLTKEVIQQLISGGRSAEPVQVPLSEKGISFARCVRATAAAKMYGTGPDGAIDQLKKWGNHDLAEKWGDARQKAMAAGNATSGGFLVPDQFSTEGI